MPAADIRPAIQDALAGLASQPLEEAATQIFGALGYASDRRLPVAKPGQFLTAFDPQGRLNERDRASLERCTSLHFLFQVTDAELTFQPELMDDPAAVHTSRIESYLFFAAELPPGHYTRTELAQLIRAVNKPLPMPALMLLRHGDTASLGIIHRRLSRRDAARDVLEKVTLIKDIALADPIRAHLEILQDFSTGHLAEDFGFHSFVSLHEAWQKRLGSYALSNDFYREIADWYFWAKHQVEDGTIRLPQHCDTEQEQSLFLIRLLTRVIFCWFLVEKRLVPGDLFREHNLPALLKDFRPSRDPSHPDTSPSFYRAILQNLFFGTLNMPPESRAFREKKKAGQRYDQNYGITNLWRYEAAFRDRAAWEALAAKVPFLNGGLFDCLDDKSGKKKDNFILDGFSDREDHGCHLPNDLFFGPERTVDLSHDYGEEDKRTARSKRAKVRGLIEILSRYKFTIEENTPLEEEIALDPELLGKVFENLLASYNEDTRTTARKALGAFYTPREIVSYMVDEALKSYLASQVPRCKGALDDLFSNKATLKEIKPETREALIAAIGRVKILDPACGSGAFPMGALHRLVDLLQKLDPNNESWKRDRLAEARRYRELLRESGAGKDELAACDARIADIEKSFDTRYHALDFARKLYLIENCIYGVDIQPIATQIAKLRFFISLVVEQKVEPKAPNLGVRPLPNLETRLVAADTLIPIDKTDSDLFSSDLDRLRAELADIRHQHFNARSPAAKRKWREADAAKRHEIAATLEDSHALSKDAARKLAAWDPYDQNTFAPFFDSEWMFGLPVGKVRLEGKAPATLLGNLALINEAGGQGELTASAPREIDSGFDVVIGNPPYISKQNFRKRYPEQFEMLKKLFDTAKGRDFDVFGCFIEKSVSILKPDGVLSFIVASGWYSGPGFNLLRQFVACQTDPLIIVNLPYDVFAAAWVDTTILVTRKRTTPANWPRKERCTVNVRNFDKREKITESRDFDTGAEAVEFATWFASGEDTFLTRSDARIVKILAEIEQHSIPLEQFADIQRGVTPFATTSTPLHRNSRPAFNGTVRRYKFERGPDCYIRYDDSLAEFKPERYFTGKRILLRELISRQFELQAAVVDEPFITNKSMQSILPNEAGNTYFLLGCINSLLMSWLFLQRSNVAHRDDFPKIVLKETRALPIPRADGSRASLIGNLAAIIDYLHNHFTANPAEHTTRDPLMVAYWERVLNGLVYELYFSEEVRGSLKDEGGRMKGSLFTLVEEAELPDIEKLPEADRLPCLRRKFEELADGTHPLRLALNKLQTLETVRIIEGKS